MWKREYCKKSVQTNACEHLCSRLLLKGSRDALVSISPCSSFSHATIPANPQPLLPSTPQPPTPQVIMHQLVFYSDIACFFLWITASKYHSHIFETIVQCCRWNIVSLLLKCYKLAKALNSEVNLITSLDSVSQGKTTIGSGFNEDNAESRSTKFNDRLRYNHSLQYTQLSPYPVDTQMFP